MTKDEILRGARIGGLMLRLEALKNDGRADWMLADSWCSDQRVWFAIVRRRGEKLGQPATGTDLEDVLRRAVAYAEAPV